MITAAFSENNSEQRFVAVKTLKSPNAVGDDSNEAAQRRAEVAKLEFFGETKLMKKLRHPNLVAILGTCTVDVDQEQNRWAYFRPEVHLTILRGRNTLLSCLPPYEHTKAPGTITLVLAKTCRPQGLVSAVVAL